MEQTKPEEHLIKLKEQQGYSNKWDEWTFYNNNNLIIMELYLYQYVNQTSKKMSLAFNLAHINRLLENVN